MNASWLCRKCAAWPRTNCLSLNSISVLAFKTPCLPGLSSEPLFTDVYFISDVLLVWGSVEFSSGAWWRITNQVWQYSSSAKFPVTTKGLYSKLDSGTPAFHSVAVFRGHRKMVFSSIYISAFLEMFTSFFGLSTLASKHAPGDSIGILF